MVFVLNPCHALPLNLGYIEIFGSFVTCGVWLIKNLKSILNLSWKSPTVNLNCKVCSSFIVRKYTLRLRSTTTEEEEPAVYSLHISRICQPLKQSVLSPMTKGTDHRNVGGLWVSTTCPLHSQLPYFLSILRFFVGLESRGFLMLLKRPPMHPNIRVVHVHLNLSVR